MKERRLHMVKDILEGDGGCEGVFSMTFLLGIIIFFSGCMEHEIPVPPHPPGEVEMSIVNLGSDYGTQMYYSLSSKEVVASNNNNDWDIAFSCSEASRIVRLNSSKFMSVANTTFVEFSEDLSEEYISSLDFAYEYDSGLDDEYSIGDVGYGSNLLIMNLGYDLEDNELGHYRLMVDSVDNNGYYIRYSDLQLTFDSVVYVSRNDEREWIHFSMLNHEVIELEPMIGEWDVLFTRYTVLIDEETNYQVVGVLSPPTGTMVSENSKFSFDEVKIADWDTLSFTGLWNEIGYDWKVYDMDEGEYTVDTERSYAVKCPDGREFVIRFLDFYDEMGNLGTITFESAER